MNATIMYRNSYDGGDGWTYYPITVEIADTCPKCGGQRGEPTLRPFCEDGEFFNLSTWENPCGHVDLYRDIYAESKLPGPGGAHPAQEEERVIILSLELPTGIEGHMYGGRTGTVVQRSPQNERAGIPSVLVEIDGGHQRWFRPNEIAPIGDEDDADILARLSDHVPGESSRAAHLDQLHRDGQAWAADEPDHARAVLAASGPDQPCPSCHGDTRVLVTDGWRGSDCYLSPCPRCRATGRVPTDDERRAWLDGIAYGLEHGYTGLRPRMELEEACEACNGTKTVTTADRPYLDGDGEWRLSRRRIPCPECTEEGAALVEREADEAEADYWASRAKEHANPPQSMSDLDIIRHESGIPAYAD